MEFVIGLDGGGTKTMAVAADMDGNVLARASGGPTNPNSSTEQQVLGELNDIFNQLEQQPRLSDWYGLTAVFAGIAGTANRKNKYLLQTLIEGILPEHVHVRVEPDTVNALYSGTYGNPGIVHIAGTGSITYGINSQGAHGRVGGWGYLLGDEGSGYDIGKQGLTAALRGFDGRGPNTLLLNMMQQHFHISEPREMIDLVYSAESPKNEIAALSKLVLEADRQGDGPARTIVGQAVQEISLSISTLYDKLFQQTEVVPVVLCGGIFSEMRLANAVKDALKESVNLTICLPAIPPVGGSLIGAYGSSGKKPLDRKMIETIIKTI